MTSKNTCGNCQYLRDLSSLGMGIICFKELQRNEMKSWTNISKSDEACSDFQNIGDFDPLEWDEKKNAANIEKHGVSFERAYEIFNSEFSLRLISETTEKIDIEKFKEKDIPLNEGNLDPYRDEIYGFLDDVLYILVTTFRHDICEMKYRVISLRPASREERARYESFKSNDSSEL